MVNIYANSNKSSLNKIITSDLEKFANRIKTLTTAFIREEVIKF